MSDSYLCRYTDLPSLIYLLSKQKVTLLDPRFWDDSNDSYYLSLYKRKKNIETVLALCFTQSSETYHHWKVFAGSSSGISIFFKRSTFLGALRKVNEIRFAEVDYRYLNNMRVKIPDIEELPFVKRHAFVDEKEFRIIYESSSKKLSTYDIPVPLTCISRIVLNPWIPTSLTGTIKHLLTSIKGCKDLKVYKSTLINNEEWKKIGEHAS